MSLHRDNIKTAINLGEHTNERLSNMISLVIRQEFAQLHDQIAKETNIKCMLNYFDFFGSEATLINLLRKIDLTNDVYMRTIKCFSCNHIITTSIQLGSIGSIISNIQLTIQGRMQPIKCKACNSTNSNLDMLKGYFETPILTFEIGHLPEPSRQLIANKIDETIFIPHRKKNLCYKLAGYTISIKDHFYLLVELNETWYNMMASAHPK